MRTIKITEGQYRRLLGERHHSYDNGLQDAAVEIVRRLCDKYDRLVDELSRHRTVEAFWQPLETFNGGGYAYHLKVAVVPGNSTALDRQHRLLVGIDEVRNAVESGDTNRLSQLVYHEMGHLTNIKKSRDLYGSTNNTKRDFNTPLFLGMDNEKYNEINKSLYHFVLRELRARCFETTMFIKLNKGVSLQDVYDNRCSDITFMRSFIDRLKGLAQGGEENDEYGVIDRLYRECVYNKGGGKRGASWENKCRKTITFFENRLNWLKNRVDKIYYDLTQGEE